MKDDINEILDKLNNSAEHYILYDYEVKQLLDYITNLQEENVVLKSQLLQDNKSYYDMKDRIKKAIEYIENNKQLSMFADLRKEGTHQYDLECDADDLLEILQGKSDE